MLLWGLENQFLFITFAWNVFLSLLFSLCIWFCFWCVFLVLLNVFYFLVVHDSLSSNSLSPEPAFALLGIPFGCISVVDLGCVGFVCTGLTHLTWTPCSPGLRLRSCRLCYMLCIVARASFKNASPIVTLRLNILLWFLLLLALKAKLLSLPRPWTSSPLPTLSPSLPFPCLSHSLASS